ncbi:hypothetical protein N7462_000686 [Penicillium macrosclerotiorum]|uniref:uncharacterized protein n=1 Tax=Penicillium macrosclerotiorum TaxID=303699 RepID=UPI002549B53C|nr:uncharacterized protein N7462_000686 [Penicillium macrosclerotiorum]KAJ5698681.1 hypothetical protein N7462_000686 [Penicillium macrosclerotiorum]
MEVHVVSKQDNSKHAAFTLLDTAYLPPLAESSIRIRTQILSLTSNNLTYVRLGDIAHWWDPYPVSDHYPAPYNDNARWGIAPAWGYATVEESTIPELVPGTVLHGFWPTSAALTDLKLKPSVPKGNWVEVSEHRQQVMPLYNRYVEIPASLAEISNASSPTPSQQEKLNRLAWPIVILCRAGSHLNEYVFPVNPETTPIHPFGSHAGGQEWTAADADLSSAVMLSLGASTKTAKAFAYFFNRRPKETAPLGFLQVTSSVDRISAATEMASPTFPSKAIDYSEITSDASLKWLRERSPSKIVILDFGSRSNSLDLLLNAMKSDVALQSAKVVIVQIGSQQKVYTQDENLASVKAFVDLGKVQYNTSSVEDILIETLGMEKLFTQLNQQAEALTDHIHECAPGLELIWGSGVAGAHGIEAGWDRLCRGQVGSEEALVYRVQRASPTGE